MPNEYLIPFGIDGGPFFKTLNEMDQGVDTFAANSGDALRAFTNDMKIAAESGGKLITTIDANGKKLLELKTTAKQVNQALTEALSAKNSGVEFETKMKKYTDLLAKFFAQSKTPLKFNVDTAKLEYFEKLITDGAADLTVLNQVLEHTRNVMAGLDPQSEEWAELSQQIEVTEAFLKEFGQTSDAVNTKNKTLKTELRQMKSALEEMELAGKGNTAEFRALSLQAGALEDQIGDVANRVRVLASDTKNIDAVVGAVTALAGGFTAAQGAIALFGEENEEVQRVIQKVTGAMAVLQGVQAVAQALNKDSALSVLLFSRAQQTAAVTTAALTTATVAETGATVAATTATNAFKTALLSNPITAVLVAIAAVVVALIAFTSSSEDAEEATNDFNRALEKNNQLLSLDEAALKRRTDVQVAQAKRSGASESEIMKIEGNAAIERLKIREDFAAKQRAQYNDARNRRNLEPAELKKLGDELIKTESDIEDIRTEIAVKRIDVSKKQSDEAKERAKEAAENSKKALEEEKKNAAERRAILDQQVKWSKELRDALVEQIRDQYDKERAETRNGVRDKIDALNAETGLSKKAIQDRDALIVELRKNLADKLKQIDIKEAADRAMVRFAYQQQLVELQEEGTAKEINAIANEATERRKAINEQFKNEKDLREQLIEAVNAAEVRATKKVTDAAARQNMDEAEQRAILEIETSAKFLPDLIGIEEAKNLAILQKRLEFAKKSLALLVRQGEAENSIVVLNAKKLIQDLEKEIGNASADIEAKDGIINFQTLIFGDQGEEGNAAIAKALAVSMESIKGITDFIVDQYQRQIDKRQEVIDSYNDSISDLESQLEEEKQLRADGLANNVDGIKKEIDEKKALRDEEVKQQEELQKKQNAARRAQLAIDTVVQASNLITAASEIFAALAGIPFIGVPLAITTIALMSGAFIAAKVKAFQSVGDGQKFAKGGWIDGPDHSRGGKKYRATDGTGEVLELEGGEHVTRKKQAKKYADLLEAINSDDISGMSDVSLRNLLSGLGIHLQNDEPQKAINVGRENDELRSIVVLPGEDLKPELVSINENVGFLAQRERDRTERWEDAGFIYTRSGNKTTRVKK